MSEVGADKQSNARGQSCTWHRMHQWMNEGQRWQQQLTETVSDLGENRYSCHTICLPDIQIELATFNTAVYLLLILCADCCCSSFKLASHPNSPRVGASPQQFDVRGSEASLALMASLAGRRGGGDGNSESQSDWEIRSRRLASTATSTNNNSERHNRSANGSNSQLRQWNDIVMKPTKRQQLLGRVVDNRSVDRVSTTTTERFNTTQQLDDKVIDCCCCCCC